MSKESLYQDRKDTVVRFPPPPQPSQHHHHHGGHGRQQQLECFSDEVDSRGSAEQKKPPGPPSTAAGGGGDGSSIEVAKRRRGRPPGSKNKPKPPVVITREAEQPAAEMRPHVLEIPSGCDVIDALARFARRRNRGICVLAGTGAVANVSLRQPSPAPSGAATAIVFHGRYDILSLSATLLPPSMSAVAPNAAAAAAGLSISLAGPHGQIVGGAVAGPLFAATTVVVVAAAFTNPTFHRLPAEEDASVSVSVSVSGSGDADEHHAHQHRPHPHQPDPHAAAAPAQQVEPCGMSIYACHSQPHEAAIWAPTARVPHPPPY